MNRSLTISSTLILLAATSMAFAADNKDGKTLYATTCIACHGAKAQGTIPGVPDLAKNGSLAKTDEQLTQSILKGFQSKGSPLAMPPKGGNPNLTAEDAEVLVQYLRTIAAKSK